MQNGRGRYQYYQENDWTVWYNRRTGGILSKTSCFASHLSVSDGLPVKQGVWKPSKNDVQQCEKNMRKTVLEPDAPKAVRQTIATTRCFTEAEDPDKLVQILKIHNYFTRYTRQHRRDRSAYKNRMEEWQRKVQRFKENQRYGSLRV